MKAYSICITHRTGGSLIKTRGQVLGGDGHSAIKTALGIVNSPNVLAVSARLISGGKP